MTLRQMISQFLADKHYRRFAKRMVYNAPNTFVWLHYVYNTDHNFSHAIHGHVNKYTSLFYSGNIFVNFTPISEFLKKLCMTIDLFDLLHLQQASGHWALCSPYSRGRQSPARGPNPARELRQYGPLQLVSFHVKSRSCAPANHTERWAIVFLLTADWGLVTLW